uniref:AAA+ ATPase domain-containing protein n=1 Tax=viral metagenome TaxID=1070528 RepID=A0A6C0KEQ8_9ZZZZ
MDKKISLRGARSRECEQRIAILTQRTPQQPAYQRCAPRGLVGIQWNACKHLCSDWSQPFAITGRHGVGKTTVALLLVCKAGRRAFFANPEDDSAALLAMARRLDPRRDTLIIDDADANPKACQELLRRYRCAVVTAAKLPDALRAIPSVKLPALPPEVVQAAMQQCRPAISERACARVWAQARGDFRLAMTTVELGTYFSEIDHRDADDKAPLPTLAARIVDSSLPWADRAHAAQVAAGAEHLVHAGYVPRDAETLETWARRFSDIDVGAPAVALATHLGALCRTTGRGPKRKRSDAPRFAYPY